jgi:hypothetical protein
MSDLELCYLTAAQAIWRFTDNSLSPVELKQAPSARDAATGTSCQRLFSTTLSYQQAFAQPLHQPDTRITSGDQRC